MSTGAEKTYEKYAWIIFLVFAGIGLVGGLTGLLAAHRRRGWRAVLRATVAGLLLDLGLSTALWLAGRCASSSGWGAIISPEAFACEIFSSLAFPLACGAACAAWIFGRANE